MNDSGLRVYALVIGPSLPKQETRVGRCYITPMSFTKQKNKKFKPIEFNAPRKFDTYHRTYVATWNSSHDQRLIRTKYAMYIDTGVNNWESAINIAYQAFEDVAGVLSIAFLEERKLENKTVSYFYPYDYQIVGVFNSIEGKEQKVSDQQLFNGASYSSIEFPRRNFDEAGVFIKDIESLLARAQHNPSLKQAIEYLMYAERCLIFRLPTEITVLNLCKAIETLLNNFNYKRGINTFKAKVKEMNDIFKLTNEELKEVTELWDHRSKNDVAHAADNYSYSFGYLNSIPTSKNKFLAIMNQPAVVAKMIKKYSDFLDTLVHIKVERWSKKHGRHEELIYVVNRGYYTYESNQRNIKKLIPELKRRIVTDLNVPYRSIKIYFHKQKREFLFQTSVKVSDRNTKTQKHIIFGA